MILKELLVNVCVRRNAPKAKPLDPLGNLNAEYLFQLVGVDVSGPFSTD